jgi:tRNA G10  N-methylase Trm11
MDKTKLPELPSKFEYRLDLRHHVTPRLLRPEPIHRWFVFPHSFSPQLIDKVLEKYPIREGGKLLDPFVGAGTTVLRAKELGISATGSDLSPLSIFASQVKINHYDKAEIEQALLNILSDEEEEPDLSKLPKRLRKAFTDDELQQIEYLNHRIQELPESLLMFFSIALLNVEQQLSRAVPDGGWFRWVDKPGQGTLVRDLFKSQAENQIEDLKDTGDCPGEWKIQLSDARNLDDLKDKFDGLITSPPYPNRHDYSRIFHMELLSLGTSEEDIFKFRHDSIRSHVEARKPKTDYKISYVSPGLDNVLKAIPSSVEPRIVRMIKGYFDDLYLCLKAARKVLNGDAPVAFVVGNVRHGGVMIPVDEILAEIGEQVGLKFEAGWVARLRGNSAQQMAVYGREPSRETIVIFKNPITPKH